MIRAADVSANLALSMSAFPFPSLEQWLAFRRSVSDLSIVDDALSRRAATVLNERSSLSPIAILRQHLPLQRNLSVICARLRQCVLVSHFKALQQLSPPASRMVQNALFVAHYSCLLLSWKQGNSEGQRWLSVFASWWWSLRHLSCLPKPTTVTESVQIASEAKVAPAEDQEIDAVEEDDDVCSIRSSASACS